jgi:hydroxymethylglutaryl-CoA lyase
MANPAQVKRTFTYLMPQFPGIHWSLHTHNTRAMALPNILAAIECGVRDFDSSVGGLGGCPYAPGATGNVCSEDLVHCLHEMGFATGVDLDKLIETAKRVEEIVGYTLPGQVMKAGQARRRYHVPHHVAERLAGMAS